MIHLFLCFFPSLLPAGIPQFHVGVWELVTLELAVNPVYRLPCTVYRVQCTVYSVQYTVMGDAVTVLCTVYCVLCTVYSYCVTTPSFEEGE